METHRATQMALCGFCEEDLGKYCLWGKANGRCGGDDEDVMKERLEIKWGI